MQQRWLWVILPTGSRQPDLPHAVRIRKCFAKTDHFRDWLFVSEGFDAETEINDLNTFTTRVEKLGTDVGSKSDGRLLPLWLKADRLSAPGWARCARGRDMERGSS